MSHKARLAALVAAAGSVGVAGCSSSNGTSSTTPTTARTSTTSSGASLPGGSSSQSTSSSPSPTPVTPNAASGSNLTIPPAPPGAQVLQQASANGATYARYSVTGQTPAQVVAAYQSALQGDGYTVNNSGGGGGGWGKWGGAGGGLTANRSAEWISVQAGGQNAGPTYFEVCVGPSEKSVDDCENASDGPDSSHSRSGPS